MTIENISHFLSGGDELVEKSPKFIAGQVTAEELKKTIPKRPQQIGSALWQEITDWKSWGLLWALLLISFPLTSFTKSPNRAWLSLIIVGGITLYALILLVTPWYLPLLLDKGIPDRLLLHLIGPIALLIGASASTNRLNKI